MSNRPTYYIVCTMLMLAIVGLMIAGPMGIGNKNSTSYRNSTNKQAVSVSTGAAVSHEKKTKIKKKKISPTTYYVYHNGGLIGNYSITHIYEGDSAVSPYIEYDGDGVSIKMTNGYTVILHKSGNKTIYETYDSGVEILSKKIP